MSNITTSPITYDDISNDVQFLYSNNPEEFSSNGIKALYGCSITNKTMEFGWYHTIDSGSTRILGIALENTGTSTVSVSYKGYQKSYHKNASSQKTSSACADVMESFLEIGSNSSATIAGGSACILTPYSSIAANKKYFSAGHFCITTSGANGTVYARVFVAPSSTTPISIFGSNVPIEPCSGSGQFCGIVDYTQKEYDIDITNVAEAEPFAVAQYPFSGEHCSGPENTNEYDTVVAYKSGGKDKHYGNYDVIYNVTFRNTSGATRYLKVIPRDDDTQACILYKLNNGNWEKSSVLDMKSNPNDSWPFNLGTSTATFKMINTGGNCGNKIFLVSATN